MGIEKLAFSAVISAYADPVHWRRRRLLLFLEVALLFEDPVLLAQPPELLALLRRECAL